MTNVAYEFLAKEISVDCLLCGINFRHLLLENGVTNITYQIRTQLLVFHRSKNPVNFVWTDWNIRSIYVLQKKYNLICLLNSISFHNLLLVNGVTNIKVERNYSYFIEVVCGQID